MSIPQNPVTHPIETAPRQFAERVGPSPKNTGGVINNFNESRPAPQPEGELLKPRAVIDKAVETQNAPGAVSPDDKLSQSIHRPLQ